MTQTGSGPRSTLPFPPGRSATRPALRRLDRWPASAYRGVTTTITDESLAAGSGCWGTVLTTRRLIDARLPSGERLHAVSRSGTSISLRVPARRAFTLPELVAAGSMSTTMAALLHDVMAARLAVLVCGWTSTGKTTLLAALLSLVPDDERIVLVEDSAELAPDHPHTVHLEARPANAEGIGEITVRTLVRQALRMRPDRLVG